MVCVWPGIRQLCLRKNLMYGFMQMFSFPFKTIRGVSRQLGVSHLCSISKISSSLQIELVSFHFSIVNLFADFNNYTTVLKFFFSCLM